MRLLVPTDFSKCANNAMTFALELASRTNAEVHVVHVIYPTEGSDNNVYNALWIDEYYQRREHDLKRWINRFRRNQPFKSIKISSSCETGFPVSTIKKVAAAQQSTLIVMGTTGATGLRGAIVGSTAAGIAGSVEIPVLAIPSRAQFKDQTSYVLATDLELTINKVSLQMLREILRAQHANIHILHVTAGPEKHLDRQWEDRINRELNGITRQLHYLHDTDVSRAVHQFINQMHANGLIVISHHHSFLYKLIFQRVSRQLIQHAQVPILVLHD